VGALQLADTHAHTLQVLPFKANEDQEWEDDCGTTLNWVEKSGKRGIGNVTIKFKDQRVFQIESGTPRFRTVEGLAIYDSPEKVRRYYTDLRAYVLLDAPIRAFGDRPLIFWLNNKRGIAFACVYNPEEQRRYLYRIIVFRPNAEFCPEDETTDSPKLAGASPILSGAARHYCSAPSRLESSPTPGVTSMRADGYGSAMKLIDPWAEVYVTPIRGGAGACFCSVRRFDERKKPPNGGQTKAG
jgi:hypothetical protein